MSHGKSPAESCQDLKLFLWSRVHRRVAVHPPDLSAWLSPLFGCQSCRSVLIVCCSFKKCKKILFAKSQIRASSWTELQAVPAYVIAVVLSTYSASFMQRPFSALLWELALWEIKLWLDPILPDSDPVLGAAETIDCLLPYIIIDRYRAKLFSLWMWCFSVSALSVSELYLTKTALTRESFKRQLQKRRH